MYRPKGLKCEDVVGAGLEIFADIDFEPMCVEFTMKKGFQRIVHAKRGKDMLIGFEPWIQFSPKDWDEMIAKTFREMVELWNEKYAALEDES